MWPRSQRRNTRGFTLAELLVTITALVVVLTLSGQLLFATRNASDRQRLQTEPRQTARGATDYLNYLVRTATDQNNVLASGNPQAIITWYTDGNATPTNHQATFNNLTAAQESAGLGDAGTDIVTLGHADSAATATMLYPTSTPAYPSAGPDYWQFNQACPDSAANLTLFRQLTGAHTNGSGATVSDPIVEVDANGYERFYQITQYSVSGYDNTTNCAAANPLPNSGGTPCVANQGCIGVVANPLAADQVKVLKIDQSKIPSKQPIYLFLGVHYFSLRVRGGALQQRAGIFNDQTDNPGTAFQTLLPNVEDLQIAWIFNNGQIRNSSTSNELTTTGQVPAQGSLGVFDAINVAGMRVTVTARSSVAIPDERDNRYLRPAAEDRVAATTRDKFFRVQLSAASMIRNRWGGR
jgi:prepilin-type N-terminal cleavage/methylation domain-containing protein